MKNLENKISIEGAKLLTTGKVAQICGVNIRTVNRWSDRGYIPAIHLPGRGDRRIQLSELLKFMKSRGLPIPQDLVPAVEIPLKILIVENEPHLAKSIERALRPVKAETKIAHDGFQAGFLMRDYQPQLITLDLHMPGLDGFEVLKIIQEISETINWSPKVLVISGKGETELRRAERAGAHDTLPKPFKSQEIVDKVKNLL